ncbi:MAG: type IV pilus twitching motility protein PilT [Myxococcales bacterium]|nr:type IV pilus twitching motility protein PilT [Myxococcales bacterium]
MTFSLAEILEFAVKNGASDIHLKVGNHPHFRVDGSMVPVKGTPKLTPEFITKLALEILSERQKAKFRETLELDLSYGIQGVGRFRINIFQQRENIGMVCRVIPSRIKSLEDLLLPKVIERIALEQRGMVLVTGATGSGKSTTVAAMLEFVNAQRPCHIVTIEDPVEFLLSDKQGIINQREVGVDTKSFASALRASLRQDPDVIFIGELRDLETIETAILAAETGHLLISTTHTVDAKETINRLVTAFPPFQQPYIRLQFASLIRGIISQRLIPRADGKGRVAATEILVNTGHIRELLADETRVGEIPVALAKGHSTYGTQTFDQSIMLLYQHNMITYEEALAQCSNPDDFALKISGINASDDSWLE